MRTQSPLVESTAARVHGALAPHTLFILPELAEARRDDLTLLILADGNRRSASGGGYAGGARRVVSIAEHLARGRDVGALVACILSPDNIAKRGNGFFVALYREFIHVEQIEYNRQVAQDFKRRLANAFLFSKPISANQTETLWKNLATISSG